MSSQASSALPSVANTFGALYVGAIIAAMLFGITNLQVAMYYKKYPNDWWFYRYSVVLLWALDTLHVALSTHALYVYMIDMFGDFIGALELRHVWTMQLQLSVNDLLVVYVQWLYAIRLWRLGRHFHKILPWFVFLAVAASLGAGIFIVCDIIPNLASVSVAKRSVYVYCSTIAATDFIIALPMCYYLHKSRAATNFTSTADLLLRLMRLVLVSGLATSACSLLTLIAFIVWPESLIFLGIHFVLSKLYVNSILAMFNFRSVRKSANPTPGHSRVPAVLRITSHSAENSTAETNISIPLSEIRDIRGLDHKLNHSKETLDCQV
ncbi:hypothetical protein ARMSODRAFT_1024376 [Armillaria solidipes]|uniref:DUF6534 domain-containing protein n=1 Tax=Armillaria solidipes TaxID=1076256 RepID=A0A2H3B2G7_9AGAR|nr:hypothetical protein ARMSODRAFT_1024376 [Armillaria solidipes]